MKKLIPTDPPQLSPNHCDSSLMDVEDFREEMKRAQLFIENLNLILKKWPNAFDNDLFKSYHYFLAASEKEFRDQRSLYHQLRIICSLYILRKKILRSQRSLTNQLELEFRLLPTCVQFQFHQKNLLGIAIVIQMSSHYERFEDSHAMLAVQKLLPNVQMLKESFLAFQKPHDLCRLLYLEVQQPMDSMFSLAELGLLKKQLKEEMKKHIEMLQPSVFGAFNVEENLRNIFFLSQEIQCDSNLALVTISLHQALETMLIFRIVVLRALKKDSPSIVEGFQKLKSSVEYIHERSSIVGHLEPEGIPKEVVIFRLQIPNKSVCSDSSLNLFKSRQYVFSLLHQVLGDIRDYNGGILAKQQELLHEFKQQFQSQAESDSELLEAFFHAIRPVEMQAIVPLKSLVYLFNLFLQAKEEDLSNRASPLLKIQQEGIFLFAILLFHDPSLQERINETLNQAQITQELTACFSLKDPKGFALGYIFPNTNLKRKEQFCLLLNQGLHAWIQEKHSIQTLRLSPQQLPVSLDPRLGGDIISEAILKLLFEGLMRIGNEGKPHFALAKDLHISEDGKRYTFILRNAQWTNGDPVTAQDFCYSWKKILLSSFKSTFAYFFFYPILNAKKIKEGRASVNTLGVQAVDDTTLVVQLEHPCPYFLELVSHSLYSPINHVADRIQPNWPLQTGPAYVCNGPFCLAPSSHQEGYELKKNSRFWNHNEVALDSIQIYKTSAQQALELFKKEEIDWLGRPLSAWEPLFSQGNQVPIEKAPLSSTYWFSFNVKQFPFQSVKLRQAFSLAIDRQKLINQVNIEAIPALTPLPFIHTHFPHVAPNRKGLNARDLFEKALQELGLNRRSFSSFTVIHSNSEIRKKMVLELARQWKETLGITIKTEGYSFKKLFAKTSLRDYQIGAFSWKAGINDSIYTLNAFKYSEEGINVSKWENDTYQNLLDRADRETNPKSRAYFYAKAEALLIREVPVIPIVHEPDLYLKQSYVTGVSPTRIGSFDFTYAQITTKRQLGT